VEVIKRFLEDVVQVVPLESIAYAIAYGKPDEIAIQCAEAFVLTKLNPPFSLLMQVGLRNAFDRIQSGVSPDVIHDMEIKAKNQSPDTYPRYTVITKDSKHLAVTIEDESATSTTSLQLDWEKLKKEYGVVPAQHVAPDEVAAYISKLQKEMFVQNTAALKQGNPVNIICGLSVEQLYPITTDPAQQLSLLKSPINILQVGRQKLDSLGREAREITPAQRFPTSVLSRCNALMLKNVNEIRQGDLAICTSLLGGFMEQQEIDIPLVV